MKNKVVLAGILVGLTGVLLSLHSNVLASSIAVSAYSTVLNNLVAVTRRPNLNSVNGGCVDDAAHNSTDCTFVTSLTGVALLGSPNTFTALNRFTAGYNVDPAFLEYEVSGCASGCTNPALTQTQITTLHSSPIVILAAQGNGTLIQLDHVILEMIFNTSAYSGGGTVTIQLAPGIAVSGACTNAIFSNTFTTLCVQGPGSVITGPANYVNQSMILTSDFDPTCSSTCGTLSYWVKYFVITGL